MIQINKHQKSLESHAVPVSSVDPWHICRGSGWSPRPFACDKDEHSADGDEAVFEWGHGEDGELGTILQRKNSKKPPAPGRTAGTDLQEDMWPSSKISCCNFKQWQEADVCWDPSKPTCGSESLLGRCPKWLRIWFFMLSFREVNQLLACSYTESCSFRSSTSSSASTWWHRCYLKAALLYRLSSLRTTCADMSLDKL